MNSLFVILSIIIILAISYLYLRNKQFQNILESFDNASRLNSTQSSSSTYYQSTVDADSYMNNRNAFNTVLTEKNVKNAGWNGIWRSESDTTLNAHFVQNNDKVIIAFSNTSFDNVVANGFQNTNVSLNCPNNSFLGIGQLNRNKTVFNLVQIICNNYINNSLDLEVNKFSGKIEDNIIRLYSDNKGTQMILTKLRDLVSNSSDYPLSTNYIDAATAFTTSFPEIPDSEYNYIESYCRDGSTPCMNNSNGISSTTYNAIGYNACGTTVSSTDNTCATTSCFIYSTSVDGIPTCERRTNTYDYMNYSASTTLSNMEGSSLRICNTVNKLKLFNTFILCYVSDVGNVLTLNSQYYGPLPQDSSLIVQSDIMDRYLNTSNIKIGILPIYRNIILNHSKFNSTNVLNAVSFTNCMENNSRGSKTSERILSSVSCASKIVKKYVDSKENNKLKPAVWAINVNNTFNLETSCPITLSTSPYYNTSVKYVEFNNDGSTSLSNFSGGTKQQLMLENSTIIQDVTTGDYDTYIAITTNLRAANELYLLPQTDNSGFSNDSKLVGLNTKPLENGKWLIIGFNMDTLDSLTSILKNVQFNILNNPPISS